MTKKLLTMAELFCLSQKIKNENRKEELVSLFAYLTNFYSLFNFNFTYSSMIWRGRKCESSRGWRSLQEVEAPPPALVRAGRLNDTHQPILYTSINQFAVLDELEAEEGDYIHMISYKIAQDKALKLGIVGEIMQVHRWGESNISKSISDYIRKNLNEMTSEMGKSYLYTDAFIADILQDKRASENNYLHSSVLARLLFEKYKFLDGLIYPSVALDRSMNIAIKPNMVAGKMINNHTFVIKVNRKYGYGVYDIEIVRSAEGKYSNGLIKWKN